jgi:hypothetical protein
MFIWNGTKGGIWIISIIYDLPPICFLFRSSNACSPSYCSKMVICLTLYHLSIDWVGSNHLIVYILKSKALTVWTNPMKESHMIILLSRKTFLHRSDFMESLSSKLYLLSNSRQGMPEQQLLYVVLEKSFGLLFEATVWRFGVIYNKAASSYRDKQHQLNLTKSRG